MSSIGQFCAWLEDTPPSMLFRSVDWVVPAAQTVHILAIAIVMATVVLLDMRIFDLAAKGQDVSTMARRSLSWIGPALIVLLLSGLVMIVAEPPRSLLNPLFRTKMVLLICAIALTWPLNGKLLRKSVGRPDWPAKAVAVLSLFVWIAIVTCGRWIAYIEAG